MQIDTAHAFRVRHMSKTVFEVENQISKFTNDHHDYLTRLPDISGYRMQVVYNGVLTAREQSDIKYLLQYAGYVDVYFNTIPCHDGDKRYEIIFHLPAQKPDPIY